MKRLILIVYVLNSLFALAQGCHSDLLLKKALIGGVPAMVPTSGSIRICAEGTAAVPCNTIGINLFSDSALTHPIANPVPTDANGNYSWCTTTGTYVQQPTGSGLVTKSFGPITVSQSQASSDSAIHNFKNYITETRPRVTTTGLLGLYLFQDGTGTNVTDSGPNGYNGTGTNISWATGTPGIVCNSTTSQVTLPIALTASVKAIQVFTKFGPFNSGGMPSSLAPVIVGNTDANGIMLKTGYRVTDASGSASKMSGAPALLQTGVTAVGSFEPTVGWHMITANLTTPNGVLYVDDQQVASYYVNTGVTTPSTGAFTFCNSPITSSAWGGTLYFAALYDHSLQPAEVIQNSREVRTFLQGKGVVMSTPFKSWGRANRLVASGDSITENNYLQYMGALDDPAGDGWALTNNGVSASWTFDVQAQIPLREALLPVNNGMRCADIMFMGTNNINGGMTTADTAASFFAVARTMRQNLPPGCKLLLGTMISRTGFDTNKNGLNSIIRTRWPEVADGIADFAADPNLGCDGCSTNLTYFQDGVHPTLPVGETLLANIATTSVNAVFGNNWSNASTITIPSYTELPKDVNLNASATSNNVVITMVPSVGYAGMTRCVRNYGVASTTNTVTVIPFGTETFDNGQTVITIPGQSTTCFVAAVSNPSTPSTQWLRISGVPLQQPFIGTAFTPTTAGASQLGDATRPWSCVQIGTSTTSRSNLCTNVTGTAQAQFLPNIGGTLTMDIGTGTAVLGTGALTTGTCATVVTVTSANVLSTDSIQWSFNAVPGTGYTAGLNILPYATVGNVNFLVCNPTAGSLTPAAATLNWKVTR